MLAPLRPIRGLERSLAGDEMALVLLAPTTTLGGENARDLLGVEVARHLTGRGKEVSGDWVERSLGHDDSATKRDPRHIEHGIVIHFFPFQLESLTLPATLPYQPTLAGFTSNLGGLGERVTNDTGCSEGSWIE